MTSFKALMSPSRAASIASAVNISASLSNRAMADADKADEHEEGGHADPVAEFSRRSDADSLVENHAQAMALHFLYYNFVRIHKTLRTHASNGRRRDQAALGNRRYRPSTGSLGGRQLRRPPILS